jgi:hypothetical protein
MRLRLPLAALTTLTGLGGAAQAEIYASGPAYGGPASIGGSVTCRIVNVGLSSVTITSRQIIDNTGGLVPPTADTCNAALAPTKNCFYSAAIGGNLAYSCRVIATGVDVRLSGVTEIQSSAHAVLNAIPLQK